MNCQKEYTTLIWAVIGSHNCALLMKHIIFNWTCRISHWRVTGQNTKSLLIYFSIIAIVCFSLGSSLSWCVLKDPARTLDCPRGRKDCLFFSLWPGQIQAPVQLSLHQFGHLLVLHHCSVHIGSQMPLCIQLPMSALG